MASSISRWREYVREGRRKIEITISTLDRLSRQRALTLDESLSLEAAIKAEGYCNRTWLMWTGEEVERAASLRAEGKTYSDIARCLSRTPDAVAARLRVHGRAPCNPTQTTE